MMFEARPRPAATAEGLEHQAVHPEISFADNTFGRMEFTKEQEL
jgi:hypothetical protein